MHEFVSSILADAGLSWWQALLAGAGALAVGGRGASLGWRAGASLAGALVRAAGALLPKPSPLAAAVLREVEQAPWNGASGDTLQCPRLSVCVAPFRVVVRGRDDATRLLSPADAERVRAAAQKKLSQLRERERAECAAVLLAELE